jgi:hypothetical protein
MAAPHPRRRLGVVIALSWLGAVLLTGTVAWRAVAVLDNGTPRTGLLSAEQVSAAVASARASAASPTTTSTPTSYPTPTETPTATPSTTPTATPTSSPTSHPTSTATSGPSPTRTTSAPPPPTEVARTWNVTGGIVSASCRDSQIRLLLATPSDGWTVESGSTGPLKIEVSLHRESQETHVVATCQSGVPTADVSTGSDNDKHGGDGHDD